MLLIPVPSQPTNLDILTGEPIYLRPSLWPFALKLYLSLSDDLLFPTRQPPREEEAKIEQINRRHYFILRRHLSSQELYLAPLRPTRQLV